VQILEEGVLKTITVVVRWAELRRRDPVDKL
jgi:hypothetical protein